MAIDILRRLAILLLMALAQVLVFNHIHLFGYAMPMLYVYFAIIIPRGYPRWATLLWCFALGLIIDLFSNTPGVSAGALTLIGLLQPYVIELFIPREAPATMDVSMKTMEPSKFVSMASFLTFVHALTFFSLEMFSFTDWLTWGLCVVGSTLLTLLLLLALESTRKG
jgi:rod shape-determining protein MreD